MSERNTSVRALPELLARYMAASASRTSAPAEVAPAGARAAPMDNDTGKGVVRRSSATDRPMRSASDTSWSSPPTARATIRNSSPPSRPTTSVVADGVPDAQGDPLQQVVAHLVAEAVVDQLEVVQVAEQHPDGRPVVACGVQGELQLGDHGGAVQEVGQRVVAGLVPQPVVLLLAVADVPGEQQHAVDRRDVAQVHRAHLEPAPRAVAVTEADLDPAPRPGRGPGRVEGGAGRRSVIGVDRFVVGEVGPLGRAPAQQCLHGVAHEGPCAVGADDHRQVGHVAAHGRQTASRR